MGKLGSISLPNICEITSSAILPIPPDGRPSLEERRIEHDKDMKCFQKEGPGLVCLKQVSNCTKLGIVLDTQLFQPAASALPLFTLFLQCKMAPSNSKTV